LQFVKNIRYSGYQENVVFVNILLKAEAEQPFSAFRHNKKLAVMSIKRIH
jgi:hypothetical protein